jgi:hypothetical protein
MKKRRLFCLLALLLSFAFARGFRLNEWGVSKGEVKANETYAYLSEDADIMTYSSGQTMFDVGATIGYIFTPEDELAAGTYIFDDHAALSRYIDDYESVQLVLTSLYGQPSEEYSEWLDEYHRGNLENYGEAIAEGDLRLETRWETLDEVIVLRLYGQQGNVTHRADYLSKTFYPQYQQATATRE